MTTGKGFALITGASSGIGAVYADRLAKRGHDLILVARNRDRLEEVASEVRKTFGNTVEIHSADLGQSHQVGRIEEILHLDKRVSVLVNDAGVAFAGPLLGSSSQKMQETIDVNISALTRLTLAVLPGMVARGTGTIINLSSSAAIDPKRVNGVYGASKAYVLAFSQALNDEFAAKGLTIQAVLPGATATRIWESSGLSIDRLPAGTVMTPEDLVDAALAGLDRGELITIPSLPDRADLDAWEAARVKLIPNLSRSVPASRYIAAEVQS